MSPASAALFQLPSLPLHALETWNSQKLAHDPQVKQLAAEEGQKLVQNAEEVLTIQAVCRLLQLAHNAYISD